MPAFTKKYQEYVLKNQFKKTYSMLEQVWLKSQEEFGSKPECYYWSTGNNPYSGYPLNCIERYEDGVCKKYTNMPSDYNGRTTDCSAFSSIILKNLKIIKNCVSNAYTNGCTPEYQGKDTIAQATNPDISDEMSLRGCPQASKSGLKKLPAIVLSDGTIIIRVSSSYAHIIAIDVNGKKGPNKWGYDIFTLNTRSHNGAPISLTGSGTSCSLVEKGGKTTQKMIQDMFK